MPRTSATNRHITSPSKHPFLPPPAGRGQRRKWVQVAAIGLPTGVVLWLYWFSAAPGLTWAHHGADGGDLIAAAMTRGVPHPSGYPLYTLLLQAWLDLGKLIDPQLEPAFWGNRFSGLCVAGATAFIVATIAALLRDHPFRWLWALLAGLTFATTPLVWSQAVITEVYGLHALFVAILGWAALRPRVSTLLLGGIMGLGLAHHLTSVLLWPALLYWRLHATLSTTSSITIATSGPISAPTSESTPKAKWFSTGITLGSKLGGIAMLVALPLYAVLIVHASTTPPPPVAWGYPRALSELWWLVSGTAYRAYLLDMTGGEYLGRLASVVSIMVTQFTPIGLALAIGGLALWDRHQPHLRNGTLLWIVPISLYAAGYNTLDSYIYLLPVVWIMSVMIGQSLASGTAWLIQRWHIQRIKGFPLIPWFVSLLCLAALLLVTTWRFPEVGLRQDRQAQEYIDAAAATLEPHSLVISSADAETFALWYGQWGSGQLAQAAPNLILVNYSLYQFGWYRELLHDLYPDVPKMGEPFEQMIEANHATRPIYLSEPIPIFPNAELEAVNLFWRLNLPNP